MKRNTIAALIALIAIVFGHIETVYFGNNMWPQSHEEIVCDQITTVLYAVAACLYFIPTTKKVINITIKSTNQ